MTARLVAASVLMAGSTFLATASQDGRPVPPQTPPQSPLILVVGCATQGSQPSLWTLSNAAGGTEVSIPVITTREQSQLSTWPLGEKVYELIGVADFVAPGLSSQIGARKDLPSGKGVNATGQLMSGHKVGIKGLQIAGNPPRINVTSAVDLSPRCR